MSVNQPDESLQAPLGSPLGQSQASNLPGPSGSNGTRDQANLAERARAEYEAWLSKKEEREAGVGQPHDYGTRDWAAKGRVPAKPSALMRPAGESSSMAHMQPAMQPPPILVRAVSNDRLAEEPVLITPQNGSPHPHMVVPDPAFLGEPHQGRPGGLSAQPSFENLHAGYANPHGMQMPPEGYNGQEIPYPQQYQYPYDPSYGYGFDPAMYQQYWSAPSWYAPQYDWHNAYGPGGGEAMANPQMERET